MSNPIGFDQLFNAKTFDDGTSKIAEYIERITDEITKAEIAADDLTKVMGKQLKAEIAQLSSASKVLSKDMQDMAQKMNDFKTTTSNTKKVLSDYERENEKLRKELEKVKTAQTNVSKETKKAGVSFKGAAQAMLGLASGAALVYSGIRILREQLILAVKSTMEFEQAMKEVQAISRASANELKLLTENANRLGATTEKTAGEIAKLQKELGKLGFNTTEILASTDAIVDLSTATGEDLANSATVAAATLRAFGLEATEMGRVVDVMAGSFVRSGLDLEKFRESMKLVAPIARATNINIETTTAALSKLADAGLSGSLAGTALRNLFSEMADPTSKLVKYLAGLNSEFADGVNSSEEMIEAFKALRDSGVDLAKAVQMVDVRARPAFFTLMNQIDAVEGLSLEYKILDSEANAIAETMRDTLTNDVAIANSAFDAMRRNLAEKLLPVMRDGAQLTATYSEAIRLLTNDIFEWGEATEWSVSKAIPFSRQLSILGKAMGGINNLISQYVSQGKFEEGIKSTTLSVSQLNNTIEDYDSLLTGLTKSEGLIKQGNFKEVISLANTEFAKMEDLTEGISSNLEEGKITEEEAAKIISKRFKDKLTLISTSIKQQETLKVTLEKQLSAHEKINGKLINEYIPALTGLDKKQTEQKLLVEQIGILEGFITDNVDKRVFLEALLNRQSEEYVETTTDVVDNQKEITKQLNEQLKLQQQLAEEKVKGDLELLKLRASKELDPVKKLSLEEEAFKKEAELINLRYNHEKEQIDSLHKTDIGYLDMRALAHEKYLNEIEQLYYGFTLTREEQEAKLMEKMHEEAKTGMDKAFDAWDKHEERVQKHKDKKREEDEDAEKEKWDKIQDITRIAAQGLSRITTFFFDNRQAQRDIELDAIATWQDEQTRLAGDNEDAKLRIELQAERKRAEIRKKQAEDNKKEAIFQIFLDTAQAVMAFLVQANVAGSIVAGALGAAQIAMVAARPIPQFAKGTDDSPEGFAEVGERGRELIKDGKTGKWALTPDSSTVTYLTKHSQVITNAETERILAQDHNSKADNYLSNSIKQLKPQQIDYTKIGQEVGKHISKIPVNVTNFDQDGVTKFVMGRSSKITRLNKRY